MATNFIAFYWDFFLFFTFSFLGSDWMESFSERNRSLTHQQAIE